MSRAEQQNWLYYLLKFFQIVAFLVGAGIFVVFLLNFINLVGDFNEASELAWYRLLSDIYGMCFAVLILLVEIRFQKVFDELPSLKNWAVRGLFYIFVGLLAILAGPGSGTSSSLGIDPETLELIVKVVAWILMGLGAAIVLGEIVCFRTNVAQKRMEKAVGTGYIV